MSLEKPIEAVTEEDLLAWITLEGRTPRFAEIKRQLPGVTDPARKDFLNDAASFANGLGGHILYGATVKDGMLVEMPGFDPDAAESARQFLEQAAPGGIEPRVAGLRVRVVPLQNKNAVLFVRIPRTWAGPHMVVFQNSNKFFSRNGAGRYLLEVGELRAAFCLSETIGEKMRAFRMDRVNAILNRALSVQISEAPKTLLHILPMVSFGAGYRINMEQVTAGDTQIVRPMQARGLVSHYNYDGLMTFSAMEKYAYSYIQVFRNGCLEAAESLLLEPKDGRKFFPSVAYEREIIQCGDRLMELLRRLEMEPPYVVMLTFLGVRGYSMYVGGMRWQSNAHQVERDNLFLDEIVIENSRVDFARAIRPAFDQVWNSCGWARSLNYDAEGNWHDASR
jgi:hypothetical protein